MSSCVGCFLRPLSVCCWLSPTCLCQFSLDEHCSVPCLWCFAFYDFSSLFEGWVCCFLFFSDLFCFVFFVQIPRLECARSDLVSDVPVFFLRAWLCALLWIYVCAGLCVLLCAYFCPLLVVCLSVCAWGVTDLGFISLYLREDPSGCLSRLAFEVMLGRFYWQFDWTSDTFFGGTSHAAWHVCISGLGACLLTTFVMHGLLGTPLFPVGLLPCGGGSPFRSSFIRECGLTLTLLGLMLGFSSCSWHLYPYCGLL